MSGHTIQTPDANAVKNILQLKVTGIRKRGRLRLRWTNSVELDFEIINEKSWRTKLNEKSLWRKLQRKALPTSVCLARYDDDDKKKIHT
ncbi:hypothetical protein TNCV_4210651 [Trichonephila clavipes]|nr:hypothetical protein TNCV_4210651 [Trichonephila clavipes]